MSQKIQHSIHHLLTRLKRRDTGWCRLRHACRVLLASLTAVMIVQFVSSFYAPWQNKICIVIAGLAGMSFTLMNRGETIFEKKMTTIIGCVIACALAITVPFVSHHGSAMAIMTVTGYFVAFYLRRFGPVWFGAGMAPMIIFLSFSVRPFDGPMIMPTMGYLLVAGCTSYIMSFYMLPDNHAQNAKAQFTQFLDQTRSLVSMCQVVVCNTEPHIYQDKLTLLQPTLDRLKGMLLKSHDLYGYMIRDAQCAGKELQEIALMQYRIYSVCSMLIDTTLDISKRERRPHVDLQRELNESFGAVKQLMSCSSRLLDNNAWNDEIAKSQERIQSLSRFVEEYHFSSARITFYILRLIFVLERITGLMSGPYVEMWVTDKGKLQ